MIGAFFLGAFSTGIRNGMRDNGWFGNKSFLLGLNNKEKKSSENKKEIDIKDNKNQENLWI